MNEPMDDPGGRAAGDAGGSPPELPGVLAMFPLGAVLLPGEVLPLQVFELRYRQLVMDLLADRPDGDAAGPCFGVTLIERGHEVGGGDVRTDVGTVARVVRIEPLAGGRYGVVAVGTQRLRVRTWLPDDPYPRAEVVGWPDVAPSTDAARAELAERTDRVRQRLVAIRRLAVEAGELREAPLPELGDDPVLATYHLVSSAPLGPADRLRLLAAVSPADRLGLLDDVLDDVEAALRFRTS